MGFTVVGALVLKVLRGSAVVKVVFEGEIAVVERDGEGVVLEVVILVSERVFK